MSLRIRRGTEAQRQTSLLDQGELAYTTDTKKLFVGDGITTGGVNILSSAAGTGLIFDQVTQTLKISGSNTIVEADTAPSLGGNLSLNNYNIIGSGNININGVFNSTVATNSAVIANTASFQRARGTGVSPLAVTGGDQLMKVTALGYTSGSYKTSSTISSSVSTKFPVTSTAVPGKIEFSVADGSGNLNLALSIEADMATRLQMYSPGNTQLAMYSYLATPGGLGTYTNFGRYAGTYFAPSAITTGDRIHTLRFLGYDGTNLVTGAMITSNVYGTVSTGLVQSDIRINCRNSSGTMLATQTNTSTQIQFNVMPVLPTFAGTVAATAAVVTPINGMMFYDSTTSKITAYSGGAWKVIV
jgi:hypothetical protein